MPASASAGATPTAGPAVNFIALALGLYVAHLIATERSGLVGRLPGVVRFGLFLIVANCAGLVFRTVGSLITPLFDRLATWDSVIQFIGGLLLIVFIVRAYQVCGGDLGPLLHRALRRVISMRRRLRPNLVRASWRFKRDGFHCAAAR